MHSIYTNTRLVILAMLFILVTASSNTVAGTYKLYVGDIQNLNVGKIKRVAVGNGEMLSTSILENGNLLVLAEKEGDTELQIWLEGGSIVTHRFYITKENTIRTASEADQALKKIVGLTTRQVGENLIVEGYTNDTTAKMLESIASKYSNIINLTVKVNLAEIVSLVEEIPGLDVKAKMVGKFVVITGSVDSKGKAVLETMKGVFSEIVDLSVEDKVAIEPMVYMNVQITEFSTNALENLGINWSTSIAGPSAGFVNDFKHHGDPTLTSFFNQTATTALSGDGIVGSTSAGFFGIATLITSTINLAVSNGDALLLASPTLSAKSGGSAKFISGGQIPVPVPGENGANTIEFKDYGIILEVDPIAGVGGNITAKVNTEVSSLDKSVSVGNVPGLKNRSAQTEVNLKDGETLVISGLVNRELANDAAKVKWLADIPILGELFQSNNFRNNRSDLVIFITPHIIDPSSEINLKQINKTQMLRKKFIQAIDENAEILD